MEVKEILEESDYDIRKFNTTEEIETAVSEAKALDILSLVITPYQAQNYVIEKKKSTFLLCMIIGGADGNQPSEIKVKEAEWAASHGIGEICDVISNGMLAVGDYESISSELSQIYKMGSSAKTKGSFSVSVCINFQGMKPDSIMRIVTLCAMHWIDNIRIAPESAEGEDRISLIKEIRRCLDENLFEHEILLMTPGEWCQTTEAAEKCREAGADCITTTRELIDDAVARMCAEKRCDKQTRLWDMSAEYKGENGYSMTSLHKWLNDDNGAVMRDSWKMIWQAWRRNAKDTKEIQEFIYAALSSKRRIFGITRDEADYVPPVIMTGCITRSSLDLYYCTETCAVNIRLCDDEATLKKFLSEYERERYLTTQIPMVQFLAG